MNIFVAKLDYGVREPELRSAFEDYGEVSSVKIVMDRDTGRSKGYGFVEMPNASEGQAAIDALNGAEMNDRAIVVKVAKPRENNNRFNRGGGGGGGYNRRY